MHGDKPPSQSGDKPPHSIRHIVHVLEAADGGTLRHVRELSATLDPLRFTQTLVLSPLRNPAHCADNIAPHVRVITLPMTRALSPWRDFAALVKLARLLKKIAPDIVHAHSSKAGALARLACAWLRVPCVYTPHALSFLDTTLPSFKRALYRGVEKFLARKTAAFVAVSREEERVARDVLKIPSDRVHFIPNGIRFPNEKMERVGDAPLSVAFIGRDAPQKGLDLFLRASDMLKKNHPDLN
ncbi:MAG: glycosyltransferase, partial [Kiritimatiellaeota bacterium]|nr:glycosyltransferase [Kiritimatiellota bacterium]